MSTSWLETRFICSSPCSRSRRFSVSPSQAGNADFHVPPVFESAMRK
jgi:hypothetical protein